MINQFLTSMIPILPKWVVKTFSNSYVAGETIQDSLKHVESLNQNGFSATIDILGEHTKETKKASIITADYCKLYDEIRNKDLDCNLSIKPSHLGLDISLETAIRNFNLIINKAIETNNFLRLDMENSIYTDNTIKIFNHCKNIYGNVGVVIQAYLKRSKNDIYNFSNSSFNARICKGIYKENEDIAFQNKEEINNNFIELVKIMDSKNAYACYATHDQDLIDRILKQIKNKKINKDKYEFQVLYGVPMGGRLQNLLENGHKVRVYVPFGPDWYEYSLRRIKENPDIAGYVIKNLFNKNNY